LIDPRFTGIGNRVLFVILALKCSFIVRKVSENASEKAWSG